MNSCMETINVRLVITTTTLYVSYFSLACVHGVFGPSLIHLTLLLKTDFKSIGGVIGLGRVGFVIGCLVSGFIIDRINRYVILSPVMLTYALIVICIPWSASLSAFGIAYTAFNVCFGILGTGLQATVMHEWRDHSYRQPVFHALHLAHAMGYAAGPAVIAPFLVGVSEKNNTGYYSANGTTPGHHIGLNISDLDNTRQGYIAVSSTALVSGLLLSVPFIVFKPRNIMQTQVKTGTSNASRKSYRNLFNLSLVFVVLASGMGFCHTLMEETLSLYMTSMAIKGFEWTVSVASKLNSVFFAAVCAGKVIGIIISKHVSPSLMLLVSWGVATAAFLLLANVHLLGDYVLWITTILAGFCLATDWASVIYLASLQVEMTGLVLSVIAIGGAIGGASSNVISGYLFQVHSYIAIPYVCISASILGLILLGIYALVSRLSGQRNSRHVPVAQKELDATGVEQQLKAT